MGLPDLVALVASQHDSLHTGNGHLARQGNESHLTKFGEKQFVVIVVARR